MVNMVQTEKILNMTNCRKISLLITKSEDTSLEGGNRFQDFQDFHFFAIRLPHIGVCRNIYKDKQ